MIGNSDHYKIVGILRYTDLPTAFALPILVNDAHVDDFFVQVMADDSQHVVAFARLEDIDKGEIEVLKSDGLPLSSSKLVVLGDHYHHALIDRINDVYVDTIVGLRQILSASANRSSTPLATRLMILDQLADIEGRAALRAKLIQSISDKLGAGAGASYRHSALRSRFWDLLVGAAAGPSAAERVRRARPRLDARFASNGQIEVEIAELVVDVDLKTTLESIVDQLSWEFVGGAHQPTLKSVDLSVYGMDPNSDQIIQAVQSSPRQEERLAILLRALLVHPIAGFSALWRVNDRANFANAVILALRESIHEDTLGQRREAIVASLVPGIISDIYFMNQGEMAYYLSFYLNDFPQIRSALADRINRSSNKGIDLYRPRIERLLRY